MHRCLMKLNVNYYWHKNDDKKLRTIKNNNFLHSSVQNKCLWFIHLYVTERKFKLFNIFIYILINLLIYFLKTEHIFLNVFECNNFVIIVKIMYKYNHLSMKSYIKSYLDLNRIIFTIEIEMHCYDLKNDINLSNVYNGENRSFERCADPFGLLLPQNRGEPVIVVEVSC